MTTSLLLVVKATVILVAALGVDALLRRRNVLLCSAMWNAALLAMLVLPIAALALPTVPVPILRSTPTAMAAPRERVVPEELQGTSLQVNQLVTNAAKASSTTGVLGTVSEEISAIPPTPSALGSMCDSSATQTSGRQNAASRRFAKNRAEGSNDSKKVLVRQ